MAGTPSGDVGRLRGLFRRSAALAVFLLGTVPMGSCVVPENITPTPTSTTHAPPVISVVFPTGPVTCIDQSQKLTTFSVSVTDADAVDLSLRWFVDYSYDSKATDEIVLSDTLFATPGEPAGYISGVITSNLLGLTVGIHTLDVAITDDFDGDGTAPPRNRAPAPGSYVASFRWVIDYLGPGTCPTD